MTIINVRYLGLRLILLSGDWVPIDLPKKISTFAPNGKIISMGGATEASIWSNIFEIKSFDFPLGSVPYGMPLTNQNMYIMHEDLFVVPVLGNWRYLYWWHWFGEGILE